MAYVGNQPVPQATQTRDRFVATSGQTSFATSGYTPNFVDVYLDGVKLDSSEYTATNGSDVVLASGASTGQIMEVVAFSSFDVADIRNMTQPLGLKNYTTTERTALTGIGAGDTIYNSTIGSIEFYDGANWIATNLIPIINSITGDIYDSTASTLTFSVSNTTDTVDIKYYESGTLLATDASVTVTSGSCTSSVPSAVYGQTAGDTITIQVFNIDGTPSNGVTKTVTALPTGGTISSSGGYIYHEFTSSGTFTNTISNLSVEYLIVAGGGSGGYFYGSGGGAGGLLNSSTTLSATSHSVVVGAGGAFNGTSSKGNDGSDSSALSLTAIGGGAGGGNYGISVATYSGNNGGSGGGMKGAYPTYTPGAGTSGQGYAGGTAVSDVVCSGGGGAGGVGGNAGSSGTAGNGGAGLNVWSTYSVAGGGAGGGNGGSGSSSHGGGVANTGGTTNTGGGGGGGSSTGGSSPGGSSGGSGIVVIRYQL
jgi:hypothetical protein